jgi:peroxiredoxin
MLQVATQAPDFTLDQVDGRSIALRAVLGQGHNAVLVFLRYLG